jgi:4a-hydroxytetrahydrobiopterin dehydratase
VREFEFTNFVGSVDFVNRITPIAEEMNHHPDLAISWNKVNVSLSTHSEGGITENDFELAAKIDSVA